MPDVSRNADLKRNFCDRGNGIFIAILLIAWCALALGLGSELPVIPKNGRIVIVENPTATDAFQARPEIVRFMVARGIERIAQKTNAAEAWRKFVSPQDVVGLKVYCAPGKNAGTRAAVVGAVIEGLLAAKIPATNIIIWDKHRAELKRTGFVDLAAKYGVGVEGALEAGWDRTNYYEAPLVGNLLWGDLEFGSKDEGVGRKSFLSKLVTQRLTKIINIPPLLNHNTAGVCGSLYSLAMGSVDNAARFEADPARLATAVPEIYALEKLGDKVALNIVDALVCQYQGEEQGLLHYASALNELRLSRDPLALDVLSLQELDWQRKAAQMRSPTNHLELYQNAALLELGASEISGIRIERVR
jgi:hypothetical protein